MTTFFSADLHLYHSNVIKYVNRPFDNVRSMHNTIQNNWNSTVGPGDDVYILGDIAFGGDDKVSQFLNSLKGHKYLVLGNHDRIGPKTQKQFVWTKHYHELKIKDDEMDSGTQKVVLFHYPIEDWNAKFHGSFHLHGHCHGTMKHKIVGRMDVGVDCHNFHPISYEDVKIQLTREAMGAE